MKVFDKSSNLRDHLEKHAKLKKFQCEICLKRYGLKTNLKRHIKQTHKDEKKNHLADKNN